MRETGEKPPQTARGREGKQMTIISMRVDRKNGGKYETVNTINDMAYALQQYAEMLTAKYLHGVPDMRISRVNHYDGTETVKIYHGNGFRTVYTVKR